MNVSLPLADGGGADQVAAAGLFVAAAAFAFVAERRLRRRAFLGVPVPMAWASAGLAAAALVLALRLPVVLRPNPSPVRPASSATIRIVAPTQGQVFHGTTQAPASVAVSLGLVGGRIVPITSTVLRPDQGHIHLSLNGALVSMAYGLRQQLRLVPGTYTLRAEFVATDHAPFRPAVQATVRFSVVP